jgi:hypothetical protein
MLGMMRMPVSFVIEAIRRTFCQCQPSSSSIIPDNAATSQHFGRLSSEISPKTQGQSHFDCRPQLAGFWRWLPGAPFIDRRFDALTGRRIRM